MSRGYRRYGPCTTEQPIHDPSYLRRSSLVSHTGAKVGLAAIFTAGIVTACTLRPTLATVIEVTHAAAAPQDTVAIPAERLDAAAPLRGERIGDAVRLIDSASATVIWQRQFPVEAEYPPSAREEDETCYPSSTRAVALAWDATTRTVLAQASYGSPFYGGCVGEPKFYVTRL